MSIIKTLAEKKNTRKGLVLLSGILFIAGMVLLVFAVYLPDKLGELVKKKGLVK